MFKEISKTMARIVVIFSLVGQVFLLSSVTTVAQAPVVKDVKKAKKNTKLSKKEKMAVLERNLRFFDRRARVSKNAKVHAERKIHSYLARMKKARTKKGKHKLLVAKNRASESYSHHKNKLAHFAQRAGSSRKKIARITGANKKRAKQVLVGPASWYGSGFRTANGERFRPNALTAAMRGFRGKKVKVVNLANNKSVVVRINDHGPAKWTGRVIDLSRGSFSKIASTGQGVISRVKLYVY